MRLSEFKDEKAIEVVAALMEPLSRITLSESVQQLYTKGAQSYEFAAVILKNNAKEIKDIFAILNGKDPKTYHCNAATILKDTISMFSDPDMMTLFGFQRQIPPSSGSASENTGGQSK